MYALLTLLLPSLAAAHFKLVWPPARGFDEDKIVDYPCGGFDSVQKTRTKLPLSGWPVQLSMEHTMVNVEVLIASGNDPSGGDYHTVLVPTFFEQGPENFCMGDVTLPSSFNATEGMNATLMVQTNGDPNGGLYQCADVTFTSTKLTSSEYSDNCKNSSGVKASALNTKNNANETEAGKTGSSGSSSSSPSSASSGGASSSSSSGLASHPTALPGMVGAALIGAMGVGLAAL